MRIWSKNSRPNFPMGSKPAVARRQAKLHRLLRAGLVQQLSKDEARRLLLQHDEAIKSKLPYARAGLVTPAATQPSS